MQLIINSKLLSISNSVRNDVFRSFERSYQKFVYKNLTSFVLYFKIKTSYNFANYKTRFALFNVEKIEKFECIYIDIYLIQICQVR